MVNSYQLMIESTLRIESEQLFERLGRNRVRAVLVVSEMALSLLLLICVGGNTLRTSGLWSLDKLL